MRKSKKKIETNLVNGVRKLKIKEGINMSVNLKKLNLKISLLGINRRNSLILKSISCQDT